MTNASSKGAHQPARVLADAPARERIERDLATTLVVEAAAGTGKTTMLVARLMSLLTTGATTLGRVVAVTFTEKAAGEMKLRLRSEIERARDGTADAAVKERLDVALGELETARIGTIHGFCADLLRERPVEAGVDPLFEVAAEGVQERLVEAAFDGFFQRALAAPPPGVARVLRRRENRRESAGPRDELRRAAWTLIDSRDFSAPWRRPEDFAREQEIDARLADLRGLAALAKQSDTPDSWLTKSLDEVARFLDELDRRERVRDGARDYDGLESDLRDLEGKRFWGWKGAGKWFAKGLERKTVLERREAVRAALGATLDRAEADLAALLRGELAEVVEAYITVKDRAGKLDFLDLLGKTRALLRDRPEVRSELAARFTHLLIDEFQDTDPLQAEILFLLGGADAVEEGSAARFGDVRLVPGKLFFVGDPKQSIYRFRRADVAFYEALKRRLLEGGAALLHLTTSFRSVPAIQEAVNATFADRMVSSPDGSQASYVPLEAFREADPGQPSLVALPVPRPYGDFGKIVNFRVDDSLPDAVGAYVDWLTRKSGWTVLEQERRVPIEARHVCLLFKRLQNGGGDVTRPYVRALEARRVPHVLVGGRGFHAREEVTAVRNVLAAIEWPDDELSVFATLRGPFLAIQDDALLAFRDAHRSLHPFRAVPQGALSEVLEPVNTALSLLRRLHRRRNKRPIADTLADFLEATRAHAGIAVWPTGEQALANVLRVLDLARRFESQGATSFRAFVTKLLDDAERGGAAEAAVVEEGTDGVRLMTVHRAKGLEFPVVILCDPTAPATPRTPSRLVDAEKGLWAVPLARCAPLELAQGRDVALRHDGEESLRLLYVAATRAKDLLVVPVCGDAHDTEGWWVDPLLGAVTPPSERRRKATRAAGCPDFGADSVFERPTSAGGRPEGSIMPGEHEPARGRHRVVVWEPAALELDREEEGGLRQQRMLAAAEAAGTDDASKTEHDRWEGELRELRQRAGMPSAKVTTVTARAKGQAGAAPSPPATRVRVERTAADRAGRPGGRRFGILVHAALAVVSLGADVAEVERVVAVQARLAGASAEERAAAVAAVVAALAHPCLTAACASKDARRECPVDLAEGEGHVEGVVDLAFRDGERWIVVDYKTDAELEGRLDAYGAQLAVYAEAIGRATGCETEAVLLSV